MKILRPVLSNISTTVLAQLEGCCHQHCQYCHLLFLLVRMSIIWHKWCPGPVLSVTDCCASITDLCTQVVHRWEAELSFFVRLPQGFAQITSALMCQWPGTVFFKALSQLVRCGLCSLTFSGVQLQATLFLSLWVQTQVVAEYKSAACFEN